MPVAHHATAALFPGQGTQARGMGAELFGRYPEHAALAGDVLGYDLVRLCLEDPDGRLDDTRYTQPALYVVNALSYMDMLERGGPEPEFLLGHSLGEYNALLAAGAFDFETGLKLVAQRAALMGAARGGGMLAVVGPSADELAGVVAGHGLPLDVANRNTPAQNVLSGPTADIDRVREVLAAKGVRVAPLRVSAAFHSRYMRPARDEFAAFLRGFRFAPLARTVIANATARPYRDGGLAGVLADQIAGTVRWSDSVRAVLRGLPAERFTEIGGKGVLTRMVRQIDAAPAPAAVRPRRVFAVAFAGGDENSYRPLGAHTGDVELVPLERPGRGRRVSESLLTDPDAVVSDLLAQMRDRLDLPFAVYGHSLGARLALLLCRRLRAEGLPAPVRLVVSGECGPSLPSRERDTWRLEGDAFWAHLDELGGVPAQLRRYEDLMAHYERVLRADFTLLGRYVHTDEPPLDVPVTAVTGDREPFTEAEVRAWQRETAEPLDRRRLPGDHFFIREHWSELAGLIQGDTRD